MLPTIARLSKASRLPLTPKRGNKDFYKGEFDRYSKSSAPPADPTQGHDRHIFPEVTVLVHQGNMSFEERQSTGFVTRKYGIL